MSQSGLSGSGDTAGNITDLIGQCQDGYEVQLRELDRQIEDEERRIQKIEAEDRACKARTAQKEQILISIRNEKQDVLKATGEIQLELKELAEMKESLQLCLKSQEDAIGLVRIRIEFYHYILENWSSSGRASLFSPSRKKGLRRNFELTRSKPSLER